MYPNSCGKFKFRLAVKKKKKKKPPNLSDVAPGKRIRVRVHVAEGVNESPDWRHRLFL